MRIAGHGYEKLPVHLKMMNTESSDKTNAQYCEATMASTGMKENTALYQHTGCESSSGEQGSAMAEQQDGV